MASVNKAIIVGALGRDPESRSMNNGGQVVSFSVATSEGWTDKQSGERKESTQWHNVVIFNENLAKVASTYLRKGSKVYIEGAIQTRKYTDRDGNEKAITEIVLQKYRGELVLLDKREGGQSGAREDSRSSGGGAAQNNWGGDDLDDSVPFLSADPRFETRRKAVL